MYRLTMEPNACVTTLRGWTEEHPDRDAAEHALIEYVCDRAPNLYYETEDSLRQTLADNPRGGCVEAYVTRAWGGDERTDHRVIVGDAGDVRWRPGDNSCDCGDYILRIEEDPTCQQ